MRFLILLLFAALLFAQSNETLIVAAYNVENWNSIERSGKPDQPKPESEKDGVVAVVSTIRPDVLALEEMGKTNDLADFTSRLHAKGLDFPNQEWLQGSDPDRHVALLSRFPIVE